MIEYWTTGLEGILATAYPLDFSWYIFFFLGDTFMQNANPLVGARHGETELVCNLSTSQPQPLSCLNVALSVFVAGISNQVWGKPNTCTDNMKANQCLFCFMQLGEWSAFAMLQMFLCKVLFVKRLTVLKIKIFTNYVITIFQKK